VAPSRRGELNKTTLDDVEWQPVEGYPDVSMRFLGESLEAGPWAMQIRFAPGYVESPHWHEADTFYIITKGEMVVGDEGAYRPGDVRWVRARTFYGPETAGADGCEFILIGAGNPAMHYEPPAGD
jgi:hypothetical protein